MTRTTTMTVHLSGPLSAFVAVNVGEDGAYENVSEYIRDLIRRDSERVGKEAFDRLKAELAHPELTNGRRPRPGGGLASSRRNLPLYSGRKAGSVWSR
jgi:Arc/MetJ-type ribon-helix-helix transcriptional regulator